VVTGNYYPATGFIFVDKIQIRSRRDEVGDQLGEVVLVDGGGPRWLCSDGSEIERRR
jgi:hypothetical protein